VNSVIHAIGRACRWADNMFSFFPIILVLLLILIGFQIGYSMGEHNSGAYDPDKTAFLYIAAHARPFILDNKSGAYVDLGWKRYVFSYDDMEVMEIPIRSSALKYNPKRRWTTEEIKNMKDIVGISPLVEGGLGAVFIKALSQMKAGDRARGATATDGDAKGLETLGDELKGSNKAELATLSVVTAGGAFAGYLAGHKDEIDLDDPDFEKDMLDLANWVPLYAEFKKCDQHYLASMNIPSVKKLSIEASCDAVEKRVYIGK
jgi:hypothetical protein